MPLRKLSLSKSPLGKIPNTIKQLSRNYMIHHQPKDIPKIRIKYFRRINNTKFLTCASINGWKTQSSSLQNNIYSEWQDDNRLNILLHSCEYKNLLLSLSLFSIEENIGYFYIKKIGIIRSAELYRPYTRNIKYIYIQGGFNKHDKYIFIQWGTTHMRYIYIYIYNKHDKYIYTW